MSKKSITYILCWDIFTNKIVLKGQVLHEYHPAKYLILVEVSRVKELKSLEGKNVKVSAEFFDFLILE